jgi:hypothetical protein
MKNTIALFLLAGLLVSLSQAVPLTLTDFPVVGHAVFWRSDVCTNRVTMECQEREGGIITTSKTGKKDEFKNYCTDQKAFLYTCTANGYARCVQHCSKGCEGNACKATEPKESLELPPPERYRNIKSSCTDTDGVNPFRKGTVSGRETGKPYSLVDQCVQEKGKQYVLEQYCGARYAKSKKIPCQFGCDNGACLQKDIIDFS